MDSIRAQVTVGKVTLVDYQPGNSCRYTLHITDLTDLRFGSEDTRDRFGDGCYTVTHLVDGKGRTMTVANNGSYLAPGYVAEKLGLSSVEDAWVLAEVIAHFTGRKADKVGP
jgi:hypothetical protein